MTIDFTTLLNEISDRERQRSISVAVRTAPASVQYRSKSLLDFTMRDVYHFSRNAQIVRASQKALLDYGCSATSSRLVTGTNDIHLRCENRLAEMLGTSSSLLFSSRSQAVLSLVSCIASERDTFFISSSLAAPFVDAAYLVDAQCVLFNPQDEHNLKIALERTVVKGNRFIVLDAISENTGVQNPISQLSLLAGQYAADVIIDESNSFGFLGSRGCGLYDLHPELRAVCLCSLLDFSTLLGLHGAALTGRAELVSLILARSMAIENEVALAPPAVTSLFEAFNMLELLVSERATVQSLVAYFISALKQEGWPLLETPSVPVVQLPFENHRIAREFVRALLERGVLSEVLASSFERRPDASVRFIFTVGHSEPLVNRTLQAISSIASRINI